MKKPLRLSIFLMGLAWSMSCGYPLDAQPLAFAQRIDAKPQLTSITLRQALMQLKKQYGIDILFEEKILQGISVSSEQTDSKATLENRLTKLLQPVGLHFRKVRKDAYVILDSRNEANTSSPEAALNRSMSLGVPQQTMAGLSVAQVVDRVISGMVKDEKGEEMPGVSIVTKGSNRGTTSDAKGRYQLTVQDQATTLVFSFVGYATQEIAIGTRTIINVDLVADNLTLNEVVVTGYTTEQKKDIVGAVSVVNTRDLLSTPSGNVTNQLQGRSPGVTVSNDGTPGGSGKVRIRGFGSFGGSDPLYVIDGVPVTQNVTPNASDPLNPVTVNTTSPIDNLNPNDIESMQILKDAAASSIYGARAANGVVIITTKKGSTGGAKITYDSYHGVNYVSEKRFPALLDATEYGTYKWLSLKNAGITPNHPEYGNGPAPVIPEYIYVGSPLYNGATLERLKNGAETQAVVPNPSGSGMIIGTPEQQRALFASLVDPANYNFQTHQIVKSANTNWFKEVYHPAIQQSHQLGVSGGSDKGNYAMSLGYFSQGNPAAKTNFFHRYTLRANTAYKVRDNIRLGQNAQFSYSESNDSPGSSPTNVGTAAAAWSMSPLTPVYDIMGNPASGAIPGIYGEAGTSTNPVTTPYRNRFDRNYNFGFFGNAYAEVDIIKGLTARTSIGIDQGSRRINDFTPITFENGQNTVVNSLGVTTNNTVTWTWTNTLSYSKVFANLHSFKVLVGSEAINFRSDNSSALRQNYSLSLQDTPSYQTLNAGTGAQTNTGTYERNALYSLFSRIDYAFGDKYLFNATLRRDQSSKFSEANRTGYFPAFGAGWRLSSEAFMKDITWINDLKLRGSWGKIGNQTGLPFLNQYSLFAQDLNYSYPMNGSTIATPLVRTQVGNSTAKWEESVTTNVGVDMTLFNNSLDFSVEWYGKETTGLLVLNQPPATGTTDRQYYANAGNMRNTGIDIGLTKRGEIVNGLRYEVGLSFSHYKNVVTKVLDSPASFLLGQLTRAGTPTITIAGQPVSEFYGYVRDGFYSSQEEVNAYNASGQKNTIIPPKVGRWRLKDVNGDGVINALDRTYLGSPHPKFQLGTNLSLKYRSFDLLGFLFWNYGNKIFNAARIATDFNVFDGNRSDRMLYESWTPELGNNAKLPILDASDTYSSTVVTDYFVEDASYLRLKTIQIGYTFPKAILNHLKLSKLRIYAQGQNLFTINSKSFSGLDPDQSLNGVTDLSMGVVNTSFPTPQQVLFGLNLGF